MTNKLILATSSPHRLEAFPYLDLEFTAESSDVDEYFEGRPKDPKKLVTALAQLKTYTVAKNHKEGIVIGFDSIGFFKGEILEKPKSREEAYQRLQKLSNNKHLFYTGICFHNIEKDKSISKVVVTEVEMRQIKDDEINKYLDQNPNYDNCALGYNPLEFYSSSFVKKIKGSYNNLTRGIPLETVVEILPIIGYKK